jgi:glycine/D-amino acid oxidase-like deaminating enzyme
VVESEDVYLVPRPDGSLLLGSTQERVGFCKEVTGKGVRGLLDAAFTLVPSLADARFVGAWAGLRPASPDGWPILGASAVPGLLFATGHFRNGILLAPITATLLADAALGAPPRELAPFSAARFRLPEENSRPRRAERVFG